MLLFNFIKPDDYGFNSILLIDLTSMYTPFYKIKLSKTTLIYFIYFSTFTRSTTINVA